MSGVQADEADEDGNRRGLDGFILMCFGGTRRGRREEGWVCKCTQTAHSL